jgi:metallophosphoesterase (TIGR03767 family)
LTVAHLSDLHLCDSQSPARAEFLDRWADPDSPIKAEVDAVGSYRAQDCLTVQVGEAIVRAVNAVGAGPIGGAPIDWALTTGDVTDNAQVNEVGWYLGLLDGGPVEPDSGDRSRYEGVADSVYWDEAFWHPDPASPGRLDRPHRQFGFPDAPGLLDALRAPFQATGLAMPWFAVHGNHDQMIQGTIPAIGPFAAAGEAALKAIGVPADWSHQAIAQFCHDVDQCETDALALWSTLVMRPVTADPARRTVTRAEFVAAHFGPSARPPGHGFPVEAQQSGIAYYRADHGRITLLTLDTVNEHGGWQGSLDGPQLDWLESELAAADRERRYVVLASHHPLATLINPRLPAVPAGPAPRRVLSSELAELLGRHPSLILWLNGHTHISTVTPHADGRSPWWEVTAPSLIDYPQQGRLVEVLRSAAGSLTIGCTMIDHQGERPWSGAVTGVAAIAGLSRELAANNWQWRTDDLSRHRRAGTPLDRNVLLELPDPFA